MGENEVKRDVYAALEAIVQQDDERRDAALDRLADSGNAQTLLATVAEFATVLRQSGHADFEGSVHRHVEELGPHDSEYRPDYLAFCAAVFETDDVDAARTALGRLESAPREVQADTMLAVLFVAGRVARDLGVTFDWSRPTPTRSASPATQRRPAPRRRRRVGIFTMVFGILGLVLIPWAIYANQDAQRLRCAAYKVTGISRPWNWTVTCLLNGNS